jgi:Flp pilus assembly protein TadG
VSEPDFMSIPPIRTDGLTGADSAAVSGQADSPVQAKRPARRSLLGKFARERRGSVAVEFGIMAMPFIMLIFAILETSLSFSTQQLLANAADRIARDVRTGRLKLNDLKGQGLHDKICDRIGLMAPAGCPELEVDIQSYATFAAVPKKTPFKANGDIEDSGFKVAPGGPGTINQLRVYYRWPVLTDFMRKYMSNLPGGKTLLAASTTWRNEPFDL